MAADCLYLRVPAIDPIFRTFLRIKDTEINVNWRSSNESDDENRNSC